MHRVTSCLQLLDFSNINVAIMLGYCLNTTADDSKCSSNYKTKLASANTMLCLNEDSDNSSGCQQHYRIISNMGAP